METLYLIYEVLNWLDVEKLQSPTERNKLSISW